MLKRLPTALLSLVIFGCLARPASAEIRAPLNPEERTNGAQTLSALEPLQKQISSCTALLLNAKGEAIATATWVGEDGYLITKASEVSNLDRCQVRWSGDQKAALREIRRDTTNDLVLAQAIGVTGIEAVKFEPAQKLSFGQWLVSPTGKAQALRIGVVSAKRRPIPGMGAAIGVRMENVESESAPSVRIVAVAEDSPAEEAGLLASDLILEVSGEKITDHKHVFTLISQRQPGDEIQVKVRRQGQEKSVPVRLASRTRVMSNFDGEDFANGGISIRTDHYKEIIQHDLPLGTRDMGGPLLDLQGRVIGINIARVDRVTTFALPSEVFWPGLKQWIEEDRHPPKALPAK